MIYNYTYISSNDEKIAIAVNLQTALEAPNSSSRDLLEKFSPKLPEGEEQARLLAWRELQNYLTFNKKNFTRTANDDQRYDLLNRLDVINMNELHNARSPLYQGPLYDGVHIYLRKNRAVA